MKKIRYFFALYVAKAAQFFLKLLGRNASYFPGVVATKICKDFLSYVTPPKTVIAVTGTNGKTTVSNLLTSILRKNGYTVTNNSFGSNVQVGVISALIEDTSLTGKPKKDIAVLEVDERSSLLVYPRLAPDFLICNNIMRDSLKRNAHTEFISYIINSAVPAKTKLILNADDIICGRLGPDCRERTYFGLEAEKPAVSLPQHIRDIVYCPVCGEKLEYDYVRYNHIGRCKCPACGTITPVPDYAVTRIDRENNTFTVTHAGTEETYELINDNIVNIYNFCGVIALLHQLGLNQEQIAKGFSGSELVKTRYDSVRSGDLNITVMMAKGQNPIACARCYDYAAKIPLENKALLLIVDDLDDNIDNSESTCWLYDCDYSALADPSISQIVFGGPRCRDHYLRAQMAGVSTDKIKIAEDHKEAAMLIDIEKSKDILVLFELYRAPNAAQVKEILVRRGQEEASKDGN